MYERPDVPKGGPHRNLIAIIVLAVVAVALVVLVTELWRLANEHSKLGDDDLTKAVSAETVSADAISQHAAQAGVTPTNAEVETVMFSVVTGEGEDSLSALYLAVLNDTDATAKLVQVPADARVQGTSSSLASVFAKEGASGLVSELTAAAVPVSHVVVMTQSGWDTFMTVAEKGGTALTKSASKLLGGIVKSDMDTQQLIEVGQRAASSGVTVEGIETVATSDATAEDGTPVKQIAPADLGRAIGTLA